MQSNVARASEKESPAFRHGENVKKNAVVSGCCTKTKELKS